MDEYPLLVYLGAIDPPDAELILFCGALVLVTVAAKLLAALTIWLYRKANQ